MNRFDHTWLSFLFFIRSACLQMTLIVAFTLGPSVVFSDLSDGCNVGGLITFDTVGVVQAQTPDKYRWSLYPVDQLKNQYPLLKKVLQQKSLDANEWEQLAKNLSQDPKTDGLQSLSLVAAGLAWFREGLYYRAKQALKNIPRNHPLLEIHLFFLAESCLHLGDYQQAAEEYEALSTLAPNSLWSHRARFRKADLLMLMGDLEGAYLNLKGLLVRYPEYPYRSSAILQTADLAIKLGYYSEAVSILHQLNPSSLQDVSAKRGRLLLETLEALVSYKTLTSQDRLKQVQAWRKWKNYEKALSEVRALLLSISVKDKLWPDIALEEVRILHKMERFSEAVKVNQSLEKSLPKGYKRRSNLWWKSESLFRLGKIEEAAQALKASRNYSKSAGTFARLGMLYFNGAHYLEAEEAFKNAVKRGEKGDPDLWMPKRLLGWLPYRLGRYTESAQYFKRLSRAGKGRNHYAHYWWARSVHKLGNEEEAVGIYYQLVKHAPYSFYAYLAQMRLEEVKRQVKTPWRRDSVDKQPKIFKLPDPIKSIGKLAQVHGENLPLWEMIYGLTLIGESSWARVYLRSLTEENRAYYRSSGARRRKWSFAPRFYLDNRDDSEYGIWGERKADKAPRTKAWAKGIAAERPTVLRKKLLDAYRALGEHYYARRASYYDGPKLTYPEANSEAEEWQRRYPRSFQVLVESSAARYSVDPHLIWALMTVESSHNPWAISRVGARGLMQVMPHTGQLSADRSSWPYFGSPLLFEPEVAIEMAAWYFQELIEQFKGQLPLAMAAYNAGPHRVKIWLEFKKNLPLDELIEEIPYAQAREYAKKVTRHLALYRRIYLGHTGHLFDLRVNPYPRGNINF